MDELKLEDMTADEFEEMLDDFAVCEPIEMPTSAFFHVLLLLDRRSQHDARDTDYRGLK